MSPRLPVTFPRAAPLLLSLGACQFGSADAERRQYESLEQTLMLLGQRQQRAARATEQRLADAVERNHWQDRDVAVLRQAQAICSRTDSLSRYLQRLRGTPGSSGLEGAAADTLQRRLNGYALYIKQFVPAVGPLAMHGPDDPRLREAGYRALKEWRFGELAFKGAPAAAARATLQRLEVEARRLEHDALNELSKKVGAAVIVFDKIGVGAVPESQQVPAGGSYRAALFLASSMGGRVTMEADGRPVPVGPDGRGRVEFVVPANAPAGPAAWEARFHARYQGRDTTLRLRVPYTIQPR
ncbi:hypothetical protein GCM10027048_43160 [Hymenobacter coalescens]